MPTLRQIYEAQKVIGFFPGWSEPEGETDYLWFDAPLEIGGVAETGLVLHGGCYSNRPEADISFELRISSQPGRRCIPLERLDWRSLTGGHSNKRRRCNDLAGRRVSDSHLHDFYLNWLDADERMQKGGLVCARELDRPLLDFQEIREYIGIRFSINNIGVVREPPWVYDLFFGGPRDG